MTETRADGGFWQAAGRPTRGPSVGSGEPGEEQAIQLRGTGIWSSELRGGDPAEVADAAAELEELGFSALWVPGGIGGDVFGAAARLLAATRRAVVATGVLNLWMHDADDVAAGHAELTRTHPGRFLLGLGISHAPLVEPKGHTYTRPLATTRDYLDRLDTASPPVPRGEVVLAALGPRMLALAAERTAGAHPYLVTPEHTATARRTLGPDALLAPEQKVVLDPDPRGARALAREHVALYLQLPNYTRNLRRLGFGDDDLADGGSDRLVDALVAWGGLDDVVDRVRRHREAGADHVCLQLVVPDRSVVPREQWRRLAEALPALG